MGLIMLLLGVVVVLFKYDLKGFLVYLMISYLGLIIVLVGIGMLLVLIVVIFYIVNYVVFKVLLFMVVGIIDYEIGMCDMCYLLGFVKFMLIMVMLVIIVLVVMVGVLLLNGFLFKEMFFDVIYEWNNGLVLDNVVFYIVVLVGVFSVVYLLCFILMVFFGFKVENLLYELYELYVLMWLLVMLLVVICLVVGIFL